MTYNKWVVTGLLALIPNSAFATEYTNPTTRDGGKCVTVNTINKSESDEGDYKIDVEIVGNCIEEMTVKVCPSASEDGCKIRLLPRGGRIPLQLSATNYEDSVRYEWGFYQRYAEQSTQDNSSQDTVRKESGPNWNFVEAAYLTGELDGFDQEIKPKGVGIKASALIGKNVILGVTYSTVSEDVDLFDTSVDVDLNQAAVSVGYRYGASKSTDIYIAASYQYMELEGSAYGYNDSIDENGYGIELGLRSMLFESFELAGALGYIDINGESETAFSVSGYYHFSRQFAIGIGYSATEDVDLYNASLRFSF